MTWDTLDSQSLRISVEKEREREWEGGEIRAERRGRKKLQMPIILTFFSCSSCSYSCSSGCRRSCCAWRASAALRLRTYFTIAAIKERERDSISNYLHGLN